MIREHCIGITYNYGVIKEYHYESIIEDILRVPENELEGIDTRGDNRFIFQVTNKERYDSICENYTGRDISVGHHCRIQVDDISSCGTRIEISRVPFSISNVHLSGMLRKYGLVYKCQNFHRSFAKYSKLKKTGDRIVWMKLSEHIPETLNICDTESSISVNYAKQPISCHKCGHTGHRARGCVARQPSDFKNAININDGLDNDSDDENSECEDENDDSEIISTNIMETDTNDLDVHLNPSQNSNNFVCMKCDYQCTYQHIFMEHMKTHIGEKTSMDDICELVNEVRSACDKRLSLNVNANATKCTECDFNCSSKAELIKHLLNHNIYACDKCPYRNNSAQGLNGHAKIHNVKKFQCSKCDFKGTSTNSLNAHMKTHMDEIDPSPQDIASQSTQASKRGLSVSPDKLDTAIKNSSRNNSKKNKTN